MSTDSNQRDIDLLKNDPGQLILNIQELIDINIKRYIRCF